MPRVLRPPRGAGAVALSLAALSLAIGIGPNIAIYSVMRATLLHALPFPDPSNLVAIQNVYDSGPQRDSAADVRAWDAYRSLFEGAGTFLPSRVNTLQSLAAPRRISVFRVSPGLFSVLGVRPYLGSPLRAGNAAGALISYSLWRSAFNADPHILGRTVRLSGSLFTITGVMPANFAFPHAIQPQFPSADAWIPLVFTAREELNENAIVLARLRNGVSYRQAGRQLSRDIPAVDRESGTKTVLVRPLAEFVFDRAEGRVQLVTWAAVFLFLLACCNAAILLLLRAAARRQEWAVMRALGAPRGALLLRQLSDAAWVALGAAAAGLGVTAAAIRVLGPMLPPTLPRFGVVAINWTTGVLTVLLATLSAVVVASVPALVYGRGAAASPLVREQVPTTAPKTRALGAIVSAEVAVALGLCVISALLAGALLHLDPPSPGFSSRGVDLALGLSLPARPLEARRFLAGFLSRSEVIPGEIALTQGIPGVYQDSATYALSGPVPLAGSGGPQAYVQAIAGRYFEAMGIPLLAGRAFRDEEAVRGDPVAVVDRMMAGNLAGPVDDAPSSTSIDRALGRMVAVAGLGRLRVIGVVGNTIQYGMRAEGSELPHIYIPAGALEVPLMGVVARSPLSDQLLSLRLGAVVSGLAGSPEAVRLAPLSTRIESVLALPRFTFALVLVFGLLAAAVACGGTFAVVAYFSALRRRELAIRAALGGRMGQLVSLMGRECARLLAPGLALGAVLALVGARAISSLFPAVSGGEVGWLLAGGAALLAAVAFAGLLACARVVRSIHGGLRSQLGD